jgi:hypothetical protein
MAHLSARGEGVVVESLLRIKGFCSAVPMLLHRPLSPLCCVGGFVIASDPRQPPVAIACLACRVATNQEPVAACLPASLPTMLEIEELRCREIMPTRANPPTATDEQVRALLEKYQCPVPFHGVRTRFLGNNASPIVSASPIKVVEDLWGGELPTFDAIEEANEPIGALVMGLWQVRPDHKKAALRRGWADWRPFRYPWRIRGYPFPAEPWGPLETLRSRRLRYGAGRRLSFGAVLWRVCRGPSGPAEAAPSSLAVNEGSVFHNGRGHLLARLKGLIGPKPRYQACSKLCRWAIMCRKRSRKLRPNPRSLGDLA